ncbi:hypothetical protein Tco_0371350 [Tanacetum coccineum]
MSTDQRTSQRKLLSYVHGPTINPVFCKADGVATRLCYAIVICVPNKQCGEPPKRAYSLQDTDSKVRISATDKVISSYSNNKPIRDGWPSIFEASIQKEASRVVYFVLPTNRSLDQEIGVTQEPLFEERLMAQRKERELATLELGFKQPLSKEEKIEKKKQRLTAIADIRYDLQLAVLDGIGKGLDPRFDVTKIAKP